MKFRPNIGAADYLTKARGVRRFLTDGDRVKITVMFRGREVTRPEMGERLCQRIADDMADIATSTEPVMGGRDMTMTLTPKGRRQGGPGVREPRPSDRGPKSGRVRRSGGIPSVPDPSEDSRRGRAARGATACATLSTPPLAGDRTVGKRASPPQERAWTTHHGTVGPLSSGVRPFRVPGRYSPRVPARPGTASSEAERAGAPGGATKVVGTRGIEPRTSRLSDERSDQLS